MAVSCRRATPRDAGQDNLTGGEAARRWAFRVLVVLCCLRRLAVGHCPFATKGCHTPRRTWPSQHSPRYSLDNICRLFTAFGASEQGKGLRGGSSAAAAPQPRAPLLLARRQPERLRSCCDPAAIRAPAGTRQNCAVGRVGQRGRQSPGHTPLTDRVPADTACVVSSCSLHPPRIAYFAPLPQTTTKSPISTSNSTVIASAAKQSL